MSPQMCKRLQGVALWGVLVVCACLMPLACFMDALRTRRKP